MLVRKILTWLFVGFLIFFVAFRPDSAANMCRSIAGMLMAMAQGMGDFFSRLMG
jgi:lauroyl/myristoyl acyltransferase